MGNDREGMCGEFWGGGQNFAFRQVWWSYRNLSNYGSLICTFVLCGFLYSCCILPLKKRFKKIIQEMWVQVFRLQLPEILNL